MPQPEPLEAYTCQDFSDGPWTRPVYRRGSGPAVIVMHEMPGLHPLVIRFADRVVDAGMTVFMPSLFGTPGKEISTLYAVTSMLKTLCIQREFDAWATDHSSPIVDWLRALARHAKAECGGRGVGAVGMCFTGNFALAMMTEPSVVAPVLSQPSLPLGPGQRRKAAIGVSAAEIACAKQRFERENLSMIGLRFQGDPLVDASRFESLRREFGDHFEGIEIDPAQARPGPIPPHAVLTVNLRDDDPEGPTHKAEARVIAFFHAALYGPVPEQTA